MRCKWCYTSGHNKRTCSSYRDYLKNEADDGSPGAANKLEKLTQKQKVKCSFCDVLGHNVKGCSVKKEFDVLLPQKEDMERRVVVQHLASLGYGKGAVIDRSIVTGYDLTTSYSAIADSHYWGSRVHLRVMRPDGRKMEKWVGTIHNGYTWQPSVAGSFGPDVPSYVPTDLQQSTVERAFLTTRCSRERVESMKKYIKEGQDFLQKMVG